MSGGVEANERQFLTAENLSEFSFDLFQTAQHLESSELLANRMGFSGQEFKVAVNFLFLKSARARKLTALRWLAGGADLNRQGIQIEDELWSEDLFPAGTIAKISSVATSQTDVSFKQALVFSAKVVAHRVFRLFRRSTYKRPKVTRAWVEVSETLFPDMFRDSHTLIYPFPMNLRRQLKFIFQAFRNSEAVSLEGIPYSLSGLLLPIFPRSKRLKAMIGYECDAYSRHALDLERGGAKQVQTSDEFEAGAVALYSRTRDLGIGSLNSAHGVGNYGPFQAYTNFAVLNTRQSDFYRLRGPEIEFVARDMSKTESPQVREGDSEGSQRPRSIVYIHQNFVDLGLAYEDRIQAKAISELQLLSKELNVEFVVKAHPNVREWQIEKLQHQYKASVQRKIQFPMMRPVFVTLNSTAFFDFKRFGPVLFYVEGSMNPDVYFAGSLVKIDARNLKKEISALLSEGVT